MIVFDRMINTLQVSVIVEGFLIFSRLSSKPLHNRVIVLVL